MSISRALSFSNGILIQYSLGIITLVLLQKIQLLLCFHTFCHHLQSYTMSHGNEVYGNVRRVLHFPSDPADEMPVQLYSINRQLPEALQGRRILLPKSSMDTFMPFFLICLKLQVDEIKSCQKG